MIRPKGSKSGPTSDLPDLMWRATLSVPPAAPYAVHVAIAGDEGTIAWRGSWEPRPVVGFVDAATGVALHEETGAALDFYPTSYGFVAMDHGWRPGDRATQRIMAFDRLDDRIAVRAMDVPDKTSLLGASPEGEQVLVFRDGQSQLYHWPNWQQLHAWRWSWPGVAWSEGLLWGFREDEAVELCAIDGSWSRSISVSRGVWPLDHVGPGVLRLGLHGIRLFRPKGNVLTVLPPTSRTIWSVSVVDNGATVRTVLDDKPRKFTVDLDGGTIIQAPKDAAHLARSRASHPALHALWHPSLDLVAIFRRGQPQILTSDGQRRFALPSGTRPMTWIRSRAGLVTIRPDSPDTSLLELWNLT